MEKDGTMFYLAADPNGTKKNTAEAAKVILHEANAWRQVEIPDHPWVVLRIGLDQSVVMPSKLATFGRPTVVVDGASPRQYDVILGEHSSSRGLQCCFQMHKETGELILFDKSPGNSTELYLAVKTDSGYSPGESLMARGISPRQCAIPLRASKLENNGETPMYFLKLLNVRFLLIPAIKKRNEVEEAIATQAALHAANRYDPRATAAIMSESGTMTEAQKIHRGLSSLLAHCEAKQKVGQAALGPAATTAPPATLTTMKSHNLRYNGQFKTTKDNMEISYFKISKLGRGAQGTVLKVMDWRTGNHYALKIIPVVVSTDLENDNKFWKQLETEIRLVKDMKHDHIIKYHFCQGFRIGRDIEIFMPLCEKTFEDEVARLRTDGTSFAGKCMIGNQMLGQILKAVHHIHTRFDIVIHRDIKPANILIRGDTFLLSDFGLAILEASQEHVKPWMTLLYAPPEQLESVSGITTKSDIYSLGATYLHCVSDVHTDKKFDFAIESMRRRGEHRRDLLQKQHLQFAKEVDLHENFHKMLAKNPEERPDAKSLLNEARRPFPRVSSK